jgi:NAD(P)-dependent dehydrogenase (short-subunit alcohol dehydrogenase family)
VTSPAAGPFEGQVALVTGAGHGVGRQVALELGSQGMALALAARSLEDLDEVAAEVEAAGGQALVVPTDVTERSSVQSLVGRVEGGLGPVDLLVTVDEGPAAAVEFLNGDPDHWWRGVEGALRGPALCSYFVLKRMVPRRRGRIVNLVGDWSLGPAPVFSELACSEAAILRLTDSLALASWSYGVSVFAVSSGRVTIETGPDPEEDAVTRAPEGLAAAARLVCRLAGGAADRLTGRFIRFDDDLEELLRRADDVEAEDCLQLRLLRLPPPVLEEPQLAALEPAVEPAAAEHEEAPENREQTAVAAEKDPEAAKNALETAEKAPEAAEKAPEEGEQAPETADKTPESAAGEGPPWGDPHSTRVEQ